MFLHRLPLCDPPGGGLGQIQLLFRTSLSRIGLLVPANPVLTQVVRPVESSCAGQNIHRQLVQSLVGQSLLHDGVFIEEV
jgi:hypothetical protein